MRSTSPQSRRRSPPGPTRAPTRRAAGSPRPPQAAPRSCYLGGSSAGLATALASAAPAGLIEAVAGLALLGALTAALAVALGDTPDRDAAVITLVVAASGVTIAGISAPFWGLVAGLGVRWMKLG